MSKHSSRKCSLAIETPMDESTPNNPLNAFLVYNSNNSSNSIVMAGCSDSISPLTPPVSRRNETTYPPASSPMLPKSSSLPNLQDINNTTMIGNRRISICDLNNFNGEVYHTRLPHLMYLHLSTSDITKTPRNFIHRAKTIHGIPTDDDHHHDTATAAEQQQEQQNTHEEDVLSPIHYSENFSHFQFRNHKRRNSVALKFEEPKIL
ncbi:hypothetical protein Cantr_06494 [Candida viswanathii]|uniref:Uncharacterized protein n=1 Tax=Candida viswanathii TaxID=5486 RepID=A0A367XUK6_9ASCO|nr:hypothetical protein Cantr_06494 [Candida viswanathii]